MEQEKFMATLKELLGNAYREDMTLAEIEEATKAMNLADLSGGNYVSLGKYNALVQERDDYKTKWTDTLNEAQKAEQAALEKEKKFAEIMRENNINRYSKKLSATIKDEATLSEIATLMADGKYEDAFEKQNAYLADEKAKLEAEYQQKMMQTNPQAQGGNGSGGEITAEQFSKMGLAERTKLYNENPEIYNKLTNQN
jgi:ribonuclease D